MVYRINDWGLKQRKEINERIDRMEAEKVTRIARDRLPR